MLIGPGSQQSGSLPLRPGVREQQGSSTSSVQERFEATTNPSPEDPLRRLSRQGNLQPASAGWKKDVVGSNVGTGSDLLQSVNDFTDLLKKTPGPIGEIGEAAGNLGRLGSAYSGGSRAMHNLTSPQKPKDKSEELEQRLDQISAVNDLIGVHPATKVATAPIGLAIDCVEQTLDAGESAKQGRPWRTAGQLTGAVLTGLGATAGIGAGLVFLAVSATAAAPFLLTAGALGAAGIGLCAATTFLTDLSSPRKPPAHSGS